MHPIEHNKTAAAKFGGVPGEYDFINQWLDETKAWYCNSLHRMFRHHSEGIFEAERVLGVSFTNSEGKQVYTRYVCEMHIREDLNGYIPSACEWIKHITSGKPALWMQKVQTKTILEGNITEETNGN